MYQILPVSNIIQKEVNLLFDIGRDAARRYCQQEEFPLHR